MRIAKIQSGTRPQPHESPNWRKAEQLLGAACEAWVFGGMDSWSDLSFGEPALAKRYEELSIAVFFKVNMSIRYSLNSD